MGILMKIAVVVIGIISVFVPFVSIYKICTLSFELSSFFIYLIFGGIFYAIYRSSLSEEKKETITRGHLIIAVIWFFPMGLYLLWKNSKNKITNTIVTAIIAFLLALGFASYEPEAKEDKSDNNISVSDEVTTIPKRTTITTTSMTTVVIASTTTQAIEEKIDNYYLIDKFIEKYNSIATAQISNVNEIDIQSSEHYKTEYRLSAFKNAVAKQCDINGELIDIVNYGTKSNNQIRMYFYTDSIDSAESFLNASVITIYDDYTDEDISKIDEELRARNNGNYYNDIVYYYNSRQGYLFVDFTKIKSFIDN